MPPRPIKQYLVIHIIEPQHCVLVPEGEMPESTLEALIPRKTGGDEWEGS